MRAIIIDDEILNIELVENFCQRFAPDVQVVGSAETVDEGIEELILKKPDLLFLDVELYDQTGFDILKVVTQPDLMVIMITAHEKYAIEAVGPRVMAYLLKPLSISKFVASVDVCRSLFTQRSLLLTDESSAESKYLRIPKNDDIKTIPIEDILHLESQGTYTHIKTLNGEKEIVAKPLTYLEGKLPAHTFLRIHNSHIINVKSICKILREKPGFIVLNNGDKVPIAERKKKEVLEKLFI